MPPSSAHLFSVEMAVNLVSHLLFLRLTWNLVGRLAGVAVASGIDLAILVNGWRDAVPGVVAIAVENIGLATATQASRRLVSHGDRHPKL